MTLKINMGNEHKKCPNIEKPKVAEQLDDDSDDIYSDYIKNLRLDTTKLEQNLKNCSKNNELIF